MFWPVWVCEVLVCNNCFIPNLRHSENICREYFIFIPFYPDLWVGESHPVKIINSVSCLLEEGKVERLESVEKTLEEKMSHLQRLDDEILEGLIEKQEICNEIERSSDIRLNKKLFFKLIWNLRRLVFLRNVLVVIQQILMWILMQMVFWRIILKA